jgi:hypothetical protein
MTQTGPNKRTWEQICDDKRIWDEHKHAGKRILKVDTSRELFEFARRWAIWAERRKEFPPMWRRHGFAEPWAAIAVVIARTASNYVGCYRHDLKNNPNWDVTAETKRLQHEAGVAQQMLDILNAIEPWDWEESNIFPVCENPDDDSEILKWGNASRERLGAFIAGQLSHQMDIAATKRVCALIIRRAHRAEASLPERRKAQKAAATAECRADYRLTEGALALWTGPLFAVIGIRNTNDRNWPAADDEECAGRFRC